MSGLLTTMSPCSRIAWRASPGVSPSKVKACSAEVAGAVELEQFGDLVLRQRLGREQVQRLGLPRHRRGHHRQRVAQRFARGGRRGDHDVRRRAAPPPTPRAWCAYSCVMPRARSAAARRSGRSRGQIGVAPFAPRQQEVPGDALAGICPRAASPARPPSTWALGQGRRGEQAEGGHRRLLAGACVVGGSDLSG